MRFSRNSVPGQIEIAKRESEERDAMRRAKEEGVLYLKDAAAPIREALIVLPEEVAREARVAVVGRDGNEITVLAETTRNGKTNEAIESLKKEGFTPTVFITTKTKLDEIWEKYSLAKSGDERSEVSEEVRLEENTIEEIRRKVKDKNDVAEFFKKADPKTATSTLLGYVLGAALKLRASDIHIERKAEKKSLLRFRIDGDLKDITGFEERQSELLISRIKLLAGLKLNVRDTAQDGRFTIKSASGAIEVRASVVPAEFGEAVVMRVLDPSVIALELKDLGLRKDDEELIKEELKRPNGMILVTGPTGSGKTTTLYAFLKKLHTEKIKIITIEDPIEYHIDGVEQTQTDKEKNYTFALGLRSILRQDPDVILVGEIRDTETAKVSIDAALTGHLVLSTLHTNNAAGAIPRLTDLGVRSSTIGPAVTLVIAQRLVKRLCESCKKMVAVDKELQAKIDKFKKDLPKRVARESMEVGLHKAVGCDLCDGGFLGRIAIMELLEVSDEIDSLIREKTTEHDIEAMAIEKQGMVLMQKDGIVKALQGITTLDEIERATGPIEW